MGTNPKLRYASVSYSVDEFVLEMHAVEFLVLGALCGFQVGFLDFFFDTYINILSSEIEHIDGKGEASQYLASNVEGGRKL